TATASASASASASGSASGGGNLPSTGGDVPLGLLIAAGMLLLLGAGVSVFALAKRREAVSAE
ncbi:MAG TPA: sortase, partial [Microbacterium sp.]|nr:sortase [Microbacterium sp.]